MKLHLDKTHHVFAHNNVSILAQLEKEILPLQGLKKLQNDNDVCIDCNAIEQAFPNTTFPVGCIHEFLSSRQKNCVWSG